MPPVNLKVREEWGAVPPKAPGLLNKRPVPFVSFSYIEIKDIDDIEIVKKAQLLHMNVKGYDDIECSFVIGRDGTVYEGRGWYTQPGVLKKRIKGNYLDISFIAQMKGKTADDPAVVALSDFLEFAIYSKNLDEDYELV